MSNEANSETYNEKTSFILGKKNVITLIIGFCVVVFGFFLMSGGENPDPDSFEPEVIFSEVRITYATITVIAGFFIVGVGIMIKPEKTLAEEEIEKLA